MNLAVREISLDCSGCQNKRQRRDIWTVHTSISPVDAMSATPSSTRWGNCEVNAAAMAPPWKFDELYAKISLRTYH